MGYPDQGNPSTIKRWKKEGRGTGEGKDYIPWIFPWEFPSSGRSSCLPGLKSGRNHQLLSGPETSSFYFFEYSPVIKDIREQFPLDQEETLAIAAQYGLHHPISPKCKKPIVMSTDMLLTRIDGILEARSIKPAEKLTSRETVEKLEIERVYWEMRKVDWILITDKEIPCSVDRNLKWLHEGNCGFCDSGLSPELTHQIRDELLRPIQAQTTPLTDICSALDRRMGQSLGTAITVVRHLLWTRVWNVKLSTAIDPRQPLALLD